MTMKKRVSGPVATRSLQTSLPFGLLLLNGRKRTASGGRVHNRRQTGASGPRLVHHGLVGCSPTGALPEHHAKRGGIAPCLVTGSRRSAGLVLNANASNTPPTPSTGWTSSSSRRRSSLPPTPNPSSTPPPPPPVPPRP